MVDPLSYFSFQPVVRAFAHSAMGHRIDPSGGSIELFLVPASGESVRSWCDESSDRSFMVDPLSYFSFHPVLHDWHNKSCGTCYPACGFPLSLFERDNRSPSKDGHRPEYTDNVHSKEPRVRQWGSSVFDRREHSTFHPCCTDHRRTATSHGFPDRTEFVCNSFVPAVS